MYNGIRFTLTSDITRLTESAFEILEQMPSGTSLRAPD